MTWATTRDPCSDSQLAFPAFSRKCGLSTEPRQHVSQWAGRRHRSNRRSAGSTRIVQRNEPWADGTDLMRPTRNLRAACKSSRQGCQHVAPSSQKPHHASRNPARPYLDFLLQNPAVASSGTTSAGTLLIRYPRMKLNVEARERCKQMLLRRHGVNLLQKSALFAADCAAALRLKSEGAPHSSLAKRAEASRAGPRIVVRT